VRVEADEIQIFAIINASFLPVIYFFYPETAGHSLESIDLLFSGESQAGEFHEEPKTDIQLEEDVAVDKGVELDEYHRVNKV
jgi:hypothetical protein